MIEERLVRAETYKKLQFLLKQYSNLPSQDLPCEGAQSAWNFLTSILKKLLSRFEHYSHRQFKLINTILSHFETFCGYLDDSKTNKVPWSIIPSLEELFSAIKSNTQFVICPIWETNYRIINRNIIEYLDEKLLRIPDLIFDSTSNFDADRLEFLKQFPSGIYFVFYPRIERLSVLHFPLLGHEIGHIFSTDWIKNNFLNTLGTHDIMDKLRKYLESSLPKDVYDPLFRPRAIDTYAINLLEIYEKILSEFLSDIVGAFIFGHATIMSTYTFSLKYQLDDYKGIPDGYLPWRLRLYFIKRTLDYIGLDEFDSPYGGANKLLNEIDKNISGISIPNINLKGTDHEYIKYLLDLVDKEFDNICFEVNSFLRKQQYFPIYNERFQRVVIERLKQGIIPNSILSEDLEETPIDIRNIVTGTWRCLCEEDIKDWDSYYRVSYNMNLLSLKAIELSQTQKEFPRPL